MPANRFPDIATTDVLAQCLDEALAGLGDVAVVQLDALDQVGLLLRPLTLFKA